MLYIGGGLACEIRETHDDHVIVTCKNDFVLTELMKINLPGAIIDMPTITDKDEEDIREFGIQQEVDIIAASFVRKASDIEEIRAILGPNANRTKIIAKIENHEGLHNYDEILNSADGVMICRTDLAMEIPPEKVFIAQKWMIEKANLAAKPCLIMTQVFDSMTRNARPTRAEASDVSNAVLDGVDAFVLDKETALGDYPINSVSLLARCIVEAERTIDWRKTYNDLKLYSPTPHTTAESVACAAVSSVLDLKVDLIIVVTETGSLARLVAKYKPSVPLICCSSNKAVIQHMNVQRGVIGCFAENAEDIDSQIEFALSSAKKMKVVKTGNKVVTIHGMSKDSPEESKIMKITTIE